MFQRIGQEYASNIHSVDVMNTADEAHCHHLEDATAGSRHICPEDVAKYSDKKFYDPDGLFASDARSGVAVRHTTPTW